MGRRTTKPDPDSEAFAATLNQVPDVQLQTLQLGGQPQSWEAVLSIRNLSEYIKVEPSKEEEEDSFQQLERPLIPEPQVLQLHQPVGFKQFSEPASEQSPDLTGEPRYPHGISALAPTSQPLLAVDVRPDALGEEYFPDDQQSLRFQPYEVMQTEGRMTIAQFQAQGIATYNPSILNVPDPAFSGNQIALPAWYSSDTLAVQIQDLMSRAPSQFAVTYEEYQMIIRSLPNSSDFIRAVYQFNSLEDVGFTQDHVSEWLQPRELTIEELSRIDSRLRATHASEGLPYQALAPLDPEDGVWDRMVLYNLKIPPQYLILCIAPPGGRFV